MPNLSWWDDESTENYLDAFKELLLPQATVLVGHHNTLWRWLMPDWSGDRPPTARDLARAAAEFGTPYVLVTGLRGHSDQHIENQLVTANSVLVTEQFERFDAVFSGAGDTLSAALAGLLATGASDLETGVHEALEYLDQCLTHGYRPGMGHVVADRLFWARSLICSGDDTELSDEDEVSSSLGDFAWPTTDTRH
jgi:hydroxymethylpyrimidine/phosphomethylpyrimidine kinase